MKSKKDYSDKHNDGIIAAQFSIEVYGISDFWDQQ